MQLDTPLLKRGRRIVHNALAHIDTLREASQVRNLEVLTSLARPAVRGLLLQRGKADSCRLDVGLSAHFDWHYESCKPELARIYETAKAAQWNGATDLDWETSVDPLSEERALIGDDVLFLMEIPQYRGLPRRTQLAQRQALFAWVLSQFLHGEQGALHVACQVTEAVQWTEGKLFGATQVVDEARHVEVFHRYLRDKIGKLYDITDNLFVVLDALLTGYAWDLKFLGMQIMVEGLALGGFGAMRQWTKEPLLRALLRSVITDEARHVHFGVVALRAAYAELSLSERRFREDWAFEMSVLLRNRFLAQEFYDEFYGHIMSRRHWRRLVLGSRAMQMLWYHMFRRIIPNLKAIGLLPARLRPHYERLGLLRWENERTVVELTTEELLNS